ncbi:MAG: hypothetical protein GY852_11230, partial [bacterium]|nr:hypothetical protein [bacterium]
MVSQTPPIAASLVTVSNTELPAGKGVVAQQIDAATFILRLPSGEVTVRVPEGSLYPGEQVSVAFSGEDVLIERLSFGTSSASAMRDALELHMGPNIEELVTLLKDLRDTLARQNSDPHLMRLLEGAIQFFEKKEGDASSLLFLISQLKQELGTNPDIANQSSSQESIRRIGELLTLLSESQSPPIGKGRAPVITLAGLPEPGLYYVKDRAEASALLGAYAQKGGDTVDTVLNKFTDQPLFIRFYLSAAGDKKAILMPYAQVLPEIEHMLHGEMKSPIMRHLDPAFVAGTIMQQGNLPVSQLQNLDELLMTLSVGDQTAIVKEDALAISLPQLVAVSLEAQNSRIPDFHTALTQIGPRIPDLVSTILQWLESDRMDARLVDLKKILFESLSLDTVNTSKKEEALPDLFRNLGFSFEHELYSAAQKPFSSWVTLQKDSPSFKLALLLILGYLNTVSDGKTSSEGPMAGKEGGKDIFSRTFTGESPQQLKEAVRDGNQQIRESASQPRIPSAVIRQQVESLLNRLESLQMLAKPVISTEGEQQVLVLPVHVGEEWTEVRIQFVKEHAGRKKGKTARHVAVTLTMALSGLGEITANMEYHTKKSLNITLTFDNRKAVEWFQERRNELI